MYKICLADLIEFQATKIKKFVLLKILCKKYNKKQPPSNESGRFFKHSFLPFVAPTVKPICRFRVHFC